MVENDSPQDYKPKSNTDFKQSVIQIIQEYLGSSGFSDRKITDTPTDALQVVNKAYVDNSISNIPSLLTTNNTFSGYNTFTNDLTRQNSFSATANNFNFSCQPQVLSSTYQTTSGSSTVLRLNTHYKGNILKRSLLSVGVKYICSVCGGEPVWCGKPITFHTDHINGNRRDNRQENLRFLCPNCHQQTPTWGNKNNANVAQRKEALV